MESFHDETWTGSDEECNALSRDLVDGGIAKGGGILLFCREENILPRCALLAKPDVNNVALPKISIVRHAAANLIRRRAG